MRKPDLPAVPDWKCLPMPNIFTKIHAGLRYDAESCSPDGTIPVLDQSETGIIGYHKGLPGVDASPVNPVVTFANHTCAVRWIDYPCSAIQNVFFMRGTRAVDTRFLYYCVKARIPQQHYQGHWPLLQEEIAYVPPLPERHKIAKILTTVDNLIEKTEALIAKYQSIKQGTMHDLFTRGVDEHGHLRPTYDDAPDRYKPSELGWIPKEWEVVICDSICREIVVGMVIQPSQYYQSWGVPVLRSANVREAGIDVTDMVYMSEESNRLLAKSMLRQGDVITVRTGYPGTSCVVPPEFDGANCVDILISRPGIIVRSEYLAMWINSDFGKEQILRKQGGLAQQHFNVSELKNLLVALPSLEEQEQIESILLTQQARIRSEEAYRGKLSLLKTGLMQDLLTGKVRVNVDEPDEALA